METFSLIKLIMGVVFVGVMISTGINNKEPTYMVVLAVLMTFGILYGVGQLPYSFFIFVVLGLMMHTYVKTGSIEDTLFNVLLVAFKSQKIKIINILITIFLNNLQVLKIKRLRMKLQQIHLS